MMSNSNCKSRNPVFGLLLANVSAGRMAAFVLSNIMGLLIVAGTLQFYTDARVLWEDEGSFLSSDYLVVNKKVDANALFNPDAAGFTEPEVRELELQPWVRSVGRFKTAGFKVSGAVNHNGAGLSTALFLESVPDNYLDISPSAWQFTPGQTEIPIIIPKDYLALYNFGFAASAGMPRLSEQIMEGVPLQLRLRGAGGEVEIPGRVVGFTNRLNTILVPEGFMDWANSLLTPGGEAKAPLRLIIDTNSPGDTAIADYLRTHGWEQAGGDGRNSAAYLLKVGAGITVAIGLAITLMSLMILLLSVSLLIERNRSKIRSLLLLGTPLVSVSRPFSMVAFCGTSISFAAVCCGISALRGYWLEPLRSLGGGAGGWWVGILSAALLAVAVTIVNIIQVKSKVRRSWRG